MAYSDIYSFLQGKVPGPNVEGTQIYIRRANGPPLILLDGDEINIEEIANIPLREVYKIEILKDASNTAVYGVRGGNGMIAFYTKRGEIGIYEPPILFDLSEVEINPEPGVLQDRDSLEFNTKLFPEAEY